MDVRGVPLKDYIYLPTNHAAGCCRQTRFFAASHAFKSCSAKANPHASLHRRWRWLCGSEPESGDLPSQSVFFLVGGCVRGLASASLRPNNPSKLPKEAITLSR